MIGPARALIVVAGLFPAAGNTQAVPGTLAFGEIEIGLDVMRFDQGDIRSVETYLLDGMHVLEVQLSSDLDVEFVTLTEGMIGYEVTLRVCGLTVMTARLQHELAQAQVLITSEDAGVVESAARQLRHPLCSDL